MKSLFPGRSIWITEEIPEAYLVLDLYPAIEKDQLCEYDINAIM